MTTYNFLHKTALFLTFNGLRYRLDVGKDISFSQTFTDSTYSQKTIHEQHKMHEASNIKKANPANFEFTIPAITNSDLAVIFNLLVDYKSGTNTLNTFDLYIRVGTGQNPDIYKLENCVITNGTFMIEKLENLKLAISGQASKLIKGATMEGTIQNRTQGSFQLLNHLSVSVGNSNLTTQGGLYSVSAELQNEIEWNPYTTVNDALNVTNATTSMYPSNFTLKKRILSGSIGQYVNSDTDSLTQTWQTGVPIVIKAGESSTQGFQFNLLNCTFTNRTNVADVFTQSYDWKMNDNPVDLGDNTDTNRSFITFNNL